MFGMRALFIGAVKAVHDGDLHWTGIMGPDPDVLNRAFWKLRGIKGRIDESFEVYYNVLHNLEVSMKTMLNVRLTPELGRQLEKVSKEEKIPISDIVRESLNRYVAVLRFQELQKKMIKKARKKGVFTDEDVFDIVS
jgi:hypothetical protein